MSTRSLRNRTADDTRPRRISCGLRSACLVAFCLPGTVAAADTIWSGSIGITSDYIQQGLSQTRGEPALQGGLRAQIDEHWTVGAWGSSIERYSASGDGIELHSQADKVRVTRRVDCDHHKASDARCKP